MDKNELLKKAEEASFEYFGILDINTIKLLPDVRQMCEVNTCRMYGKNWSCPPGCGSLEDCEAIVAKYNTGIIVQTVGKLNNSFDYRGMMELEDKHKERSLVLRDSLVDGYKDLLLLGVGACTICKECTYPEEACRFPDKMISSLESFGIFVTQLCKDNEIAYYYGKDTLSYTSCILLKTDNEVNRLIEENEN